ncbi:MAG: ATP F0F1 synthase subunit B [Pseudomonadota bacterium]
MTRFAAIALWLLAAPAYAADGESSYGFTSLFNTDYVVLIGFLLFLAIIFWFGVPGILGKLLDDRAQQIKADLDEARSLREEAQALLADYERRALDVNEQVERIVTAAKEDAAAAAELAKSDLQASIARRLQAAEDQIANAEEKAVRQVRDRAVEVAIAAAADVLQGQTGASQANKLIDASIAEVGARLN